MSTNGSKPLLEVEGLVASYPVGRGLVAAAKREPKLEVHGIGSKKERREEVKRALEVAGLTPADL